LRSFLRAVGGMKLARKSRSCPNSSKISANGFGNRTKAYGWISFGFSV
jgi:hypothetical protein